MGISNTYTRRGVQYAKEHLSAYRRDIIYRMIYKVSQLNLDNKGTLASKHRGCTCSVVRSGDVIRSSRGMVAISYAYVT